MLQYLQSNFHLQLQTLLGAQGLNPQLPVILPLHHHLQCWILSHCNYHLPWVQGLNPHFPVWVSTLTQNLHLFPALATVNPDMLQYRLAPVLFCFFFFFLDSLTPTVRVSDLPRFADVSRCTLHLHWSLAVLLLHSAAVDAAVELPL